LLDLKSTSGLSLWVEKPEKLESGDGILPVTADIRFKKDMLDVLYDPGGAGPEELYFMYRDVCRTEDRELLKRSGLRYDVTILVAGSVGSEYIKTAGHYHPLKPGSDLTYPEVYEVLHGRAHYLLQNEPDEEGVDAVLVEAVAGDKVLIPPGYGHITINPGPGILVMSNWVASDFSSVYGPIRELGGGAFFELVNNDGDDLFVVNPRYQPSPGFSSRNVEDLPEFGLVRGKPMYRAFLEAPAKFAFLTHPEEYF
jgi:glucose-6-phosphate isomerase, archaeal